MTHNRPSKGMALAVSLAVAGSVSRTTVSHELIGARPYEPIRNASICDLPPHTNNLLKTAATTMSTQAITTHGVVTSGRGNARKHIAENAHEIRLLINEVLFPGSLNLILERPLFFSNATALRFANTQRLLWPGKLNQVPVWFYRWQQTPLHVLEVLSGTKLRDRLNLKDGDVIEIEIDQMHVTPITRTSHLAWLALWAGRADWAYTHDRYYWRTRPLAIDLGATQDNGEHHPVRTLAKYIYGGVKRVPVIGPAAMRFRNTLQAEDGRGNQEDRYVFAREDLDSCRTPADREFTRIRNILNYTKTSGSAYSATQYPAGYHTLEIFGHQLKGQRDPRLRFRNLGVNFSGKRILDIGTNQGGMLFAIRDQIELGVGIDFDHRMVNAANRLAASTGADNLHFFVFDLERDPLDLISDLVPNGRIDIIFLLSVCMWIHNWRSVIRFCADTADVMVFESNGSDEQQSNQEIELRTHFSSVRIIEDSSEDDPTQKRRKLFLCEEAQTKRVARSQALQSVPAAN